MGFYMLTDINLEIFSSPGKGGCITTRNTLEIELPEWKKLFSYYWRLLRQIQTVVLHGIL